LFPFSILLQDKNIMNKGKEGSIILQDMFPTPFLGKDLQ